VSRAYPYPPSFEAGTGALRFAGSSGHDPNFFSTWLEFLQADLAFTRAYMIEFWAAGDAARDRWQQRRDRTTGLLKTLHHEARREDPAIVAVSDTVLAAVVGGTNRVVISHVLAGRREPLTSLKPELLRFITMTLASHERP
jgi:hypothetical protein